MESTLHVRTLSHDDLARCVELSSEAGWNQNEGDWRFLIERGYGYGIEMPGKGLVATTGAWSMGGVLAWINMVLVTPSWRGRGLAGALLSRCLADTKSRGQIALLDATDLGAQVYEKLGFAGTRRLVRLKRSGDHLKVPRAEVCDMGWEVRLLTDRDLDAVHRLDSEVLGASRRPLLAALLQRCPQASWVLLDASKKVRGFLMSRGGRSARQLGPLVVDEVRHARVLVTRALGQVSGPVFIDVPEDHLVWMGELAKWGFNPQRRFRRMGQDGVEMATDWSRYLAMAGPDFA